MGNYLTFTVGREKTLPYRTLVNPPSLRRGVDKIRKFSPSEFKRRVK